MLTKGLFIIKEFGKEIISQIVGFSKGCDQNGDWVSS